MKLDLCSTSVPAYDDPRMNGVPLVLKRGEPSLYDGIGTSRVGVRWWPPDVFGLFPFAVGRSITTLNAPKSESFIADRWSSTVEQECVLLCRLVDDLAGVELAPYNLDLAGVGIDESALNIVSLNDPLLSFLASASSRPAVFGEEFGNANGGCGYRW